MSPFSGILRSVEPGAGDPVGLVSVTGAIVRVRLDLVPDAVVGDRLLAEAGVAVAVVSRASDTSTDMKDPSHVSGHPR